MKKLLLMPLTLSVFACGGGGESSTPAASTATPTSNTAQPPSTALKNNTVASTTRFNQFDTHLTQLPDRTAQFKSQVIYIKLYTKDGDTLYLGRYLPSDRLNFHVPNHITTLFLDIFSADPTDPQLTEEISL